MTAENSSRGRRQRSARRCCRVLWCWGLLGLLPACSRSFFREAADEEVRRLVAEKSNDPRWALENFTIDMHPRSRYFDPADPDHPPMPPDDPASHALMVAVDGHQGYGGWYDHGTVEELENPSWRTSLFEEHPRTPDGKITLRLEDAVRLALQHSPSYQQQLETIYLSALDVSTERFRFDVQFFGGFGLGGQHEGSGTPGGERNSASVTPEATISKSFATAGELVVGFLNSITFEFFGPDDNFTSSLLNFSLVQPLLRRAGRAVALEQLTLAERTLLANLRAFQRYRQGFYTQVAIGELGVTGPQRRGGFFGGTGLTGFTGQGSGGFGGVGDVTGFGRGGFGGAGGTGTGGGAGFAGGGAGTVGGFIGLLQRMQQIRNTRDSLNAQIRTLALLEANLEAGMIDIAQVDQFRQNIETERANLLQDQNGLASALDSFNTSVLGLPPDVPIQPDDSLIRPFQLIGPAMSAVQNDVNRFIDEFGELPEQPELQQLEQALERIDPLRRQVEKQLAALPAELEKLRANAGARTRSMTAPEKRLFERDLKRLAEDLQKLRGRLAATAGALKQLTAGLNPDTITKTADGIVDLVTEISNIVGELSLVQARARLEMITVEPLKLTPSAALQIARSRRLDWMNNRAALVDTWRLIEFNANALQSDVTVRFSGEVGTVSEYNPFDFRGDTATLRGSLQFDGPFTRLVERNSFRQQLIQYQQDRRQLIRFEDGVHQTLRQMLRDLEQLRVNLEIQRRAVAIAIRRVDQTREALNEPVPPAAPGQPVQALGPTAAQNLLFALSDLRNTQNNLMSVWLNYQASRMLLYREIGIMRLDGQGIWIDEPLENALPGLAQAEPPPPPIPGEWYALAEAAPPGAHEPPVNAESEDNHGD